MYVIIPLCMPMTKLYCAYATHSIKHGKLIVKLRDKDCDTLIVTITKGAFQMHIEQTSHTVNSKIILQYGEASSTV